jgi:putative ABC transport system permease protein
MIPEDTNSKTGFLEDFGRDIKYAARSLAANRGFAFVAILTLALGIGANTAIFSVINGVVLRPLPYVNGSRLLLIRQAAPQVGRADMGVSVGEFYDYRAQTTSFDAVVEYHQMTFDLLTRGEADRVNVGVVSHDFFTVLGIQPLLGRTLGAADDARGADAVLMLSYSYWQSKFGGDPKVIGQVLEMNDRPHTIVAVLPNVPLYPQENDVYMPVSSCPFRVAADRRVASNHRAFPILTVFGRLKPDMSPIRAASDVDAVCGRFARETPRLYDPRSGFNATTIPVQDELVRQARPMLLILFGTTGMILLIACANVANLALARLLRRDRELAVRQALGAHRGRLARQLITESTLLSVIGGAAGLGLAAATSSTLTQFVSRFTSRTGEIRIDSSVLLFTAAVSILTGVVFGTIPALTAKFDLAAMLRSSRGAGVSRTRQRLHRGLVVVQLAVSVVLLVAAGLLLASFYRLQKVDPGYRGDRVLTAEVYGNFSKYPDRGSVHRLYQLIIDRLHADPSLTAVAVTNAVPLSVSQPGSDTFIIDGRAMEGTGTHPTTDQRVITPEYFKTLGVGVPEGREFTDFDAAASEPVAIVNNAMRSKYWERTSPIGSRISFDEGKTWRTIVGVAGDVLQFGLDREPVAQVYVPLQQAPPISGRVVVRTVGNPVNAAALIRESVHAVDPNLPVENIQTLDQLREKFLATPQLTATLLAIFATVALFVTMAGLTGVMALYVSQRIKEFGVRMALGATAEQVLGPVLREGLQLVTIGIVVGVLGALAATRILSAYLFETGPTDPVVLGGVIAVLFATGVCACLGPALRATRVKPLVVLQSD